MVVMMRNGPEIVRNVHIILQTGFLMHIMCPDPDWTSYDLILPHFTSYDLMLPHMTSYYLMLPHITSYYLILPHITSYDLI